MKVKQFDIKHIITVIVILSIVVIGLLLNWVRGLSNNAIIESTFDELEQISVQYHDILVKTLKESEKNLLLLADSVTKNSIDKDTIVDFFNNQTQSLIFETLYYIDMDGNGISSKNQVYDFSDNDLFIHALKNEFHIADSRISLHTNDIVFSLIVPVTKNDVTTSFLFCEISVDDFFELIFQNKDYVGDIFFVDTDLNLIYSTSKNHIGASIIPEEDVSEMGIDNVTKAQTDISNEQHGGFYYDYFGTPKVMIYYPIEMTDIALAMNVHVDSLSSEIIIASDYFMLVGTIIYWIIIILVICFFIVQKLFNKRMIKVAYYDPLTDLANLAKLKLEMCSVLENNKKKQYSIIVIDIENFKAINEMFGYDIGDRVLKAVKTLTDSFNEPSLVVARIDSDRFAMFAGNNFFDDLETFAQAINQHYDEVIPELIDYAGSFKVGRYHIELGETNFDDIMSKVNLAHVKAKTIKGEMVCDYDDTLKNQVLIEADITNKMNTALSNKEFKVYLQPKFTTNDDELVGAEALVRWIEADGNMMFPNDFIPLFERNGFIVELDKYVLEVVCMAIRRWIDDGLGKLTISVNCSRLNLENPYYVDGIVAIADKHNVPHECIEIELTESTTIETQNTIEQLFDDLRKNGFKISIDDFGAGYSSLGMLKNLHVDTLKMDKSFFVGGKNARRDDMLIDSIVKMSHNLGMYVVAEGIETVEQIELLKSMNCDAVQGYFYDKPMPISQFEEKYGKIMAINSLSDSMITPLIKHINDTKYASSLVPSGIIVTKLDNSFTIVEANDYFFDMIGYSREEIRDLFNNRGLNIMDPNSRLEIMNYYRHQMETDPQALMEFTSKFTSKANKEHTYRLSGKTAINENGVTRLYTSVVDITDYSKADSDLQNERDFIARISSLTNSSFFDFDGKTKTIRFSKNFAERFNLPDIIENFTETELSKEMFPKLIEFANNYSSLPHKTDGEFCIKLPNGDPVWHLYNSKTIYDINTQSHKVVGKMSEAFGHKLEMDILEVKSKADQSISIYDKNATERYIHNYLRISASDIDNGAFFIIELENFDHLDETFGPDFAKDCLKDVGDILRNMFRSSDIIGRTHNKEFYVFISNNISIEFAERKAEDLYRNLTKTYKKDDVSLDIVVNIGMSLYPDHGSNFKTLYEKATKELNSGKEKRNNNSI